MLRRINSSSSNRAPMPHVSNGRDLTQNLTYMRVTLDSWSWLRNIIKRIGKLDNLPVTANKCYKSALMLTTRSMYWLLKYWMLEQHIWTSWLPLSLKVLIFVTNLRHLFTMPPEITRSLGFSDRECDACVIVVAIYIHLLITQHQRCRLSGKVLQSSSNGTVHGSDWSISSYRTCHVYSTCPKTDTLGQFTK